MMTPTDDEFAIKFLQRQERDYLDRARLAGIEIDAAMKSLVSSLARAELRAKIGHERFMSTAATEGLNELNRCATDLRREFVERVAAAEKELGAYGVSLRELPDQLLDAIIAIYDARLDAMIERCQRADPEPWRETEERMAAALDSTAVHRLKLLVTPEAGRLSEPELAEFVTYLINIRGSRSAAKGGEIERLMRRLDDLAASLVETGMVSPEPELRLLEPPKDVPLQ